MAEKTLTKEQWQKVDRQLSGIYGKIEMLVDGRKVTFERCRVSKNKLGIQTFIDGVFKGAWVLSDNTHPEQRYLRQYSKFLHTKKQRDAGAKLGKRLRKEMGIDYEKKISFFVPDWSSAAQIRRHYEKTFISIELREVI